MLNRVQECSAILTNVTSWHAYIAGDGAAFTDVHITGSDGFDVHADLKKERQTSG